MKFVADTIRVSILLGLSFLIFCESRVEAKRKVFVPGRRGLVIDERLSALRTKPDLKASLEQRLRRGRRVGIIGAVRGKDGIIFLKVAVTRNTRGWILADALARPGSTADANRLLNLMEETTDDFIKMKLARLFLEEFRDPRFAPRVLLILGQTAERVAERLSRDARRRIGDVAEKNGRLGRKYYFLNFAGLDRYNRINVKFDYDEEADGLVYDGAAYRELIRRYPRSAEAAALKERIQRERN
ncbi:MAG: SH3 domain-containing protein [Acidobacteria bacterium]|nr:SH3 domain-containing protein [Acidobacteriota bacterium]